jgi:hypothetical protein
MNVLLLFATALGFIGNVAASCNDILSALKTWIPIGLQAFGAVLTLINPAAGSVVYLALQAASSLWTEISGAITIYQNNTDAGQAPTLLDKVIVLLQALATKLSSVLTDIHLNNPNDQNFATEALKLLVDTLTSIANGLTANHPTASARMTVAAKKTSTAGAQASIKSFKTSYNAIAQKYSHTDRMLK